MIILLAFLVAYFLDKSFYTLKQSSVGADRTVVVFALFMRALFMGLVAYSFIKLYLVQRKEMFLVLRKGAWSTHLGILVATALF